jgi:enoyl-[acyl-carrier-protein] reductase (NADH)
LFSDWSTMVSGEIIHVDGGVHAIAAGFGEDGTVY